MELLSYSLFLVIANIGLSYQGRDEETSFCLKNNTPDTLRTFWLEANDRCSKDPYKLMELYKQMDAIKSKDKSMCNSLLLSNVRKSIIDEIAQIFEDAINTDSFDFQSNAAIKNLATEMFKCDKQISQAVFERVIDVVYLHTDKAKLAAALFENTNFEQMALSLLYLHWKYTTRNDLDTRLPVQLVNYIRRLREDVSFQKLPSELQARVKKIVRTLPEMLNLLYFSSGGRLLNTVISEYLYAPREIGDGDLKRTALTWTKEKNEVDSDGILTLQVRENGDIAFSASYNGGYSPLVADNELHMPIFWLGLPTRGFNELKWWRVHWYEDDFLLQSALTKEFMCATREYDENRRYVTMHNDVDSVIKVNGNSPCRWALRPIV